MQFISPGFAPVEAQPEDDIDKLFTRLSQLEPPGELITRILIHVQSLPEGVTDAPEAQPSQANLEVAWEREALVVRNEQREPS